MSSAKVTDRPLPAHDSAGAQRADASEISVLGLVNRVLKHRLLVGLPMVVLALYGVLPALQAPRSYTTETTFMPAGTPNNSGMLSIGAQLGFGVATAAGSESPDFYLNLIESREILKSVAEKNYQARTAEGVVTGDLVQIFKTAGSTPAAKQHAVLQTLRNSIDATASIKTSIITLRVSAPDPELSKQIADNVLAAIIAFNRDKRQSKSSAEVDFIAERLAETSVELRSAENRLQQFLQENREYRMSPKLTFDQERLAREVALRQELYNSIAGSYERAKIERVREASVITVIEDPQAPLMPDGRGLRKKLMLNLFLGFMLGMTLAFIVEFLSGAKRQDRSDWDEFVALRRDVLNDLRHPVRAIGKVIRRAPPSPNTV